MVKNWTATLLPNEAVRILQKSAITPITARDPMARIKAIDHATKRVRLMWPQYFRNESYGATMGSD